MFFLQVASVKFSDRAEVEFNFNRYLTQDSLQRAILATNFSFGALTNRASGLRAASGLLRDPGSGNRAGVSDIVVLVTDGWPDQAREPIMDAARV